MGERVGIRGVAATRNRAGVPRAMGVLLAVLAECAACSRRQPPHPIAATCGAIEYQPGEVHVQDFEDACYDWSNRESVPLFITQDVPPFASEEEPRWMSKVASMTAVDTEIAGAYYSSWLNPVKVT